ncbi:hypothetical protein Ae201684P_006010 [Aphanomyces euteiches]|uniref:Uncharacterized protein n=1 Tax=Aphanomyces euteiches TaxID=100861 RepID=A0A6G0WVQ8_9STRA|nr:hypothetical protein Ae201684_011242 [Aphanomyces euteiches]KAH9058669.1 hypothetical protein Ae201684P_006010 [Aphanomyces euteiches]KAH9136740.1 hypothetical protein AeRB84_018255 [Aphanomyces euteiches]
MWLLWFLGDPKKTAESRRPYRTVDRKEFHDKQSTFRWGAINQIMTKLTDLTLRHELVPSVDALGQLVEHALAAVFEMAMHSFIQECGPDCTLTEESLCEEAAEWIVVAEIIADELEEESMDTFASIAMNEESHFPSLSIRELWPLWHIGDSDCTPYRFFVADISSQRTFNESKRVMEALSEVAVEEGFVSCANELACMRRPALMSIFEKIFLIFKNQFLPHCGRRIHPDLKCAGLSNKLMTRSIWKRHPKRDT